MIVTCKQAYADPHIVITKHVHVVLCCIDLDVFSKLPLDMKFIMLLQSIFLLLMIAVGAGATSVNIFPSATSAKTLSLPETASSTLLAETTSPAATNLSATSSGSASNAVNTTVTKGICDRAKG